MIEEQELEPLPDQKRSAKRTLRVWLWGGLIALLLLLLTGSIFVGPFLSSPAVIAKIQQVIAKQTRIELDFETIDLNYFPQPALVLQQVNITVPDLAHGKVAELSLFPAILPLLVGDLHLGRLSLEKPDLSFDLPIPKLQKAPVSSGQDDGLKTSLAKGFAVLGQVSPDFDLVISKGQLKVGRDQTLVDAEGLDLQLTLSVTDSSTANVTLHSKAALVNIRRNSHKETIKGIELDGSLAMTDDTVSLALKRLALDEPGFELGGKLERGPDTPAVNLIVSGKNIDVDATRRAALALAGDISPIDKIFNYLRGGTVPQITVRSHGQTADELGDLKNLRIEGELQDGSVSIPEIKVDLTETDGDVLVADGLLQGTGISTRLEGSTGHDGTLKLGLADGDSLFRLELMLSAELGQAKQILERIVADPDFIEEITRINNLSGTGTGKLVLGDSLKNVQASVVVSDLNFSADYDRVPFPVMVSSGQVDFSKNLISLNDWQGTVGDSEFSGLSCQVNLPSGDKDVSQGLGSIELGLDGTLKEDVVKWLSKTFAVPQAYAIRSPLKVSAAKIGWQKNAKTTFRGGITVNDGPDLIIDVAWQPGQLNIHNLKLKDKYSDADISLDYGADGNSLKFSGTLQHETLNTLFVDQDFGRGRAEGTFSVVAPQVRMLGAKASGHLKGSDLLFTLPSGDRVSVDQAVMVANGDQVDVDLSKLSWRNLTWDPIKATLDFSREKPHIKVAKANFCGLNSPGVWIIDGKSLALDITLDGKALDVTTVYTCVERERIKMTGTLDFSGQVSGQGQFDELIKVLQGPLEVKFSNGLIEEDKTLARVLEVLNVTEIVKGRLPNLSSNGFAYTTIELQGEFKGGKLLVKKLYMDGETLDVLGQGEIDLVQKTADIQLLASPFKTVDTVIKNIPGVNYLMAGSLVSIPVSIKGSLDDPKVQVLSASSIGSSLLRLGERTIKSPLKLIETFTPKDDSWDK